MGSKTHDEYEQKPDGNVKTQKPINHVAKPRNGTFPDDDLGGTDDDGDGEGEVEENDQADGLKASIGEDDKKKKKRKRSSKKKKKTATSGLKQTSPPRVLLSSLFPSEVYPVGEVLAYDANLARVTGEELRANDRMDNEFLSDYRQAAEVHRQVRQHVQTIIKPGKSLAEIAEEIEDGVRALVGHQGLEPGDGLKAGLGFPTGLCLNNGTAHYTPNPGHKHVVLKYEDVLKVDFGVHVNGRIVDSAFTMAFDPTYDNLLQSVRDATNTGVKAAGVDARMSEIGTVIQEVMESYEVEIKGKTYPVKAVRNITGHNIEQYRIHGGKSVPFVKNSSRQKMEEGEVYAIETFGSTGRGIMLDDVGSYGYGRDPNVSATHLHHQTAKALLKTIDEHFGTLVFCRRYLDRLGIKNYLPAMRILIAHGIIEEYGPLRDIKGSFTAQFEHTILLHGSGKEVISRGDDY